MSCEEKNEPTRCMECSYIRFNRKLAYYPNWYCKINGQKVNICGKYGWDRMAWCPLKEGEGDA